jgi:hypothetical protein
VRKNPLISLHDVVQELVNKLRQLRFGLSPDLRTDTFLHNKIVTACQGVPACRFATSDPPADIGSLLSKIYSSITNHEKEQKLQGENETFYTRDETLYTDRRYYSKNQAYGDRPHNRRPYN